MEDGFDFPLNLGAGKQPNLDVVTYERDLTQADLGFIAAERDCPAPDLKKLSQRHHMLARLLASGTTQKEASILVGYTQARVSIIANSPAFKNLLEFYKGEVQEQAATVLENLTGLGTDAINEIRDRLEEDPDEISTGELTKIVELTLDRTGHGKQTNINQTVTVDMGKRLAEARERAKLARMQVEPPLIEGNIVEINPDD